jgi:hypothetical protein
MKSANVSRVYAFRVGLLVGGQSKTRLSIFFRGNLLQWNMLEQCNLWCSQLKEFLFRLCGTRVTTSAILSDKLNYFPISRRENILYSL